MSHHELTTLLHADPHAAVLHPSATLKLVRRLPWTELEHLASLLGFTHTDLLDSLTSRTSYPPMTDRAQLIAVLIQAGAAGIRTHDAATALRWPLRRLQSSIDDVHNDPPAGARLITLIDGRRALRPSPRYLPESARHAAQSEIDLDVALAGSLWHVFHAEDLQGVPREHVQLLTDAALITRENQRARIRHEVEYCLGGHGQHL